MTIVLEFETTYYTDWKCVVCKLIRRRDYPARVIRTGTTETVQCLEHPKDEREECDCCATHGNMCPACGHERNNW